MWRHARKSLVAHKLRLALTAVAVVLGVAFMAGTLVLTATIKRNIDGLFSQAASGYSVVVRATTPYATNRTFGQGQGGGGGFGGNRPRTPASVLPAVRATPGVAAADGTVQGQVTLVGSDGKLIKSRNGAPAVAFGWVPDRQLSPFKLRSGRGPTADGELVVDVNTAKSAHLAIGSRVMVIGQQAPEPFTVVGTMSFGSGGSIAGAITVGVLPSVVQRLIGTPGFSQIDVAATTGTNTETLVDAIAARLPAGFEAVSAGSVAQEQAKNVNVFISRFTDILLAFAFIALFVGAFLIFNTFSILVGQRIRELALLRALGASREQVTGSVVLEALFTGLLGSIVGLGLGVALAAGLLSLLRSFLGLSSSNLVFTGRTAIVALLVGTVVTVLSALGPSIRASRVPPVAAMRDDAVIAEASLRRRAIVGGVVLVTGLIVLFSGLAGGGGIAIVGLGAAVTFTGVAMLIPFVASPLARVIGAPLEVRGVTGRLSRQNAMRNPRRTAATAAALMIGLAVVAAIATLASSATASFGALFTSSIKSDYVVVPSSGDSMSKAVEGAVRAAPGVTAISPFTELQFHLGTGATHVAAALDPVTGPKLFDIKMVTGSASALTRGQVLIDTSTAKSRHLAVGDTLTMGFTATGDRAFTIGGTYKPNQLIDSWLVPIGVATANTNQPVDEAILVKVARPSTSAQTTVAGALAAYPQVAVKTAAQYVDTMKNRITGFLRFVYVLLGLSIVIALIGVINTLVLSVLERTHEIGLLRAVGMVRRQVRRMIRGEAVVVSVLGAVLGLALGVGLGCAIVKAVSGSGIGQIVIPVGTIVVVLVLAVLFGIFAAIFPARRAARLDVLLAISTE